MKLLFAADMSFNYFESFESSKKAYETMKEVAQLFGKADYSMVNLENIFGEVEDGEPIVKSGPNLISDERFIEYINAIKPNVVGLANNHTKDYGENVMFRTIELLKKQGYEVIGAGKDISEAYRPAVLTDENVKVAIIAVCENEFGIAGENISGTAGYSLGRVTKEIKNALVSNMKPVVYFHGGNERCPFPSPGKVELYRHFIELGAEAVIAMHTHCPQGYEIYQGKPIVYSMGNFYFPHKKQQFKSWYYGYMSELDITDESVALEIYPYRFDFDKITILSGEEKEKFEQYMELLNKPLSNQKTVQALFDGWCMTQDYIERLSEFQTDYLCDGKSEEIRHIKNVLGCEAHNELVKNTLMMIYEGRVEAGKKRMDFIGKLQNMEYSNVDGEVLSWMN